ncbi:MAG TPA: DinB family protein [Pyrinomonadaceae bacterium]|nr:DinB family protein [Pyrinomonadaceae bacterium]
MTETDALKFLEQTPALVERILQQIPAEAMKVRNLDEFSAVESLCHLRDIEIEGYGERIRRIIQEDKPSLPDLDGARLAIERDYNHQQVGEALEAFRAARQQNLELLRGLSAEQLAREGTLENVGLISIEKLIEMMTEHDQGHLADLQIIQRRAQRSLSDTAGV